MSTTSYKLPTAIIANATGVNAWADPDNIKLVDNEYAVSSGTTDILLVGTFNLSIPQGSDLTNFTIQVKGYRGSFNTTLQIYAVDDTTGVELSYPLAPFQGFDGTNTLYTLPSSLFGTTWTVDQANNIKLKLVANGELHLDAILISADYVPTVTPVVIPPSTGAIVVDEFVQAIGFSLARSMTSSDTVMFLQSFALPDGTPIQYADFHGEAVGVIDQGIPGLEETVVFTNVEQDYQGTGLCRISFGSVTNRGLKFIYPYDTDVDLRTAHDGDAEFVLSNAARFYDRFLRKNQINALVSAPIYALDEGVALVDPVHELDFQGAGVSVVNDGGDSFKKIITIPGNGVNPPNVVTVTSATTGASQATTLTWAHTSSGINRLLVVQVEAEAASTIASVTYNGVPLTQAVGNTNGTLRNAQWYLIAPPVGIYNIVVTMSVASYITCGAETYNSTDQTAPIGTTQTSTGTSLAPSLVLTTSIDNSLVVDSLATGTLPIVYTVGAGQIENWHLTATPIARQGASSIEAAGTAPDNVTMSWAITQNVAWAQTALEIKGVASPAPSPLEVEDEGISVDTAVVKLNFIGAGVTATSAGIGQVDVTIPATSTLTISENGVPVSTATTVVDFIGETVVSLTAPGEIEVDVGVEVDGVTITGSGRQGDPLISLNTSSVSSIGQQSIPLGLLVTNDFISGSSQDGSTFFVTDSTGVDRLSRYKRDPITGAYEKTHEVTPAFSNGFSGNGTIVNLGIYIYTFSPNGAGDVLCYRFLAADLTGETNMTVPVVGSGVAVRGWTNGVSIYLIFSLSDTTSRRWTVSGTTLVAASTAVCQAGLCASPAQTCSMYDGVRPWILDYTSVGNPLIHKLANVNASTYTTTTKQVNAPYGSDEAGAFLLNISATTFYYGNALPNFNSTAVVSHSANIIPIAKP